MARLSFDRLDVQPIAQFGKFARVAVDDGDVEGFLRQILGER